MIVTLTLGPGVKPELRFAGFARTLDDRPAYLRFVCLSGVPTYEGTYPFLNLTLLLNGRQIERPALLSIQVNESDAQPSVGHIAYIGAYEDDELGIKKTTQFSFEANYPPAAFEKLWSVLSHPSGELTIKVSVQAPRTDISGYEAFFDITESSFTWPAGIYVSRT